MSQAKTYMKRIRIESYSLCIWRQLYIAN